MTRSARHVAVAVVAVVALAASLRVAVASFSPVLSFVSADIDLPSSIVGLIGATPPVAFAVFGLLSPLLARWIGLERLAAASAALSAAGLFARAFAGDATALLVTTLVAFAGMGVGNVLLPALIKKYFPARVRPMTTVYVATMSIATLIPPVIAVPFAEAAGWRLSLGVWAVVGVIAVVPWFVLGSRVGLGQDDGPDEFAPGSAAVARRLLGLPLTWAIVGLMTVPSATVYSMFAWLPALVQERAGIDAVAAGVMVGVFGGMGLPFGLIVPALTGRPSALRVVIVVAVAGGLAGAAGMLTAPTAATWLWVVLLSLPTSLFPLTLVLLGLRTRSHATTVALSGIVQSTGYGIGALFPIALGAMHGAGQGWDAALWLFAGLFVIALPAGFVVARSRTVEDAWERRHGPWDGKRPAT